MKPPNEIQPSRPPRRRPAPALVAALTLLVGIALTAVAIAEPGGSASRSAASSPVDDGFGFERPRGAGLQPFDSCARVKTYARRHREALTGAIAPPAIAEDAVGAGAGAESSAPAAAEPPPSSTNIQEQGVDEPDIVKSNGSTIFAITANRLEAVDVTAGSPVPVGSLVLPDGPGADPYAWGHQLLLLGERALVISNADLGQAPWTRTIISEIDIADPAAMSATRTLSFEGSYVSARQTGDTVRVVTSTTPDYPFVDDLPPMAELPPAAPGRPQAGRGWLPQARLRDRTTGELTHHPLVACRDIRKPRRFAGVEMLSVLTIDLARGLDPVDSDTVMTSGEIVYASPQALYVATQRWVDPSDPPRIDGSQVTTAIHKFDASGPGATDYVATGKVPGFMLSQWSMSEHEGLLRVASTTSPAWDETGQAADSESFVSVLGESGERLVEVGQVGGLGRGERIYAVRFIGEVGYVVTFRQVDPLYTIDLSDPAAPRVLGELKIPGYSAYLHPVGPGRILGIGQDADAEGRTLGAQASLFDVADLTSPARLASAGFGRGSTSEVEYDHLAFLYSESERLAVLPLEVWRESGEMFAGAVAFRIDPAGAIETPVRLSHGDSWRSAIRRSLVVGDRLYTVSARGVMAHDLATYEARGWAEFAE